jgi:hypothetical protein
LQPVDHPIFLTTRFLMPALRQAKVWLLALCAVLCAGLCAALAGAGSAWAQAGADDPPHDLPLNLAAPVEQWLPQVVPPGARVLHGPLVMPFGQHAQGHLLALRLAGGGYVLWYLTPMFDAPENTRARVIRLREPQPADDAVDVAVHAAFSTGAPNGRDIVVLETFSRNAAAGGAQQSGGAVYRRQGAGAEEVVALSRRLDGAKTAAEARQRLAPAYPTLALGSTLAAVYAALPGRYVDLPLAERMQQLQPQHPAFKTVDTANGYLETRGDASRPAYRVALFKHSEGGWLVAVQRDDPQAQQTWFLRLRSSSAAEIANAGWDDVSAQVLSGYQPTAGYRLPQRGRVLTLAQAPTPSWQWNGSRFVPRP